MKTLRAVLNVASLAVIFALAPLALGPEAEAQSGGSCCHRAAVTCWINLGGAIVKTVNAYYCEPQ